MSAAPDFSTVAANQQPTPDMMAMLAGLADRIREAQRKVARAQNELDVASTELNNLVLREVPDAMHGLSELKLRDGTVLAVKDDVKVNITEANRVLAHRWLRDNGHGGVIKRALLVDLRAIDPEVVTALEETMREQYAVEPEEQESIHPMTLKALVRELLEGGATLPECFSVFQYKIAQVKEPKRR